MLYVHTDAAEDEFLDIPKTATGYRTPRTLATYALLGKQMMWFHDLAPRNTSKRNPVQGEANRLIGEGRAVFRVAKDQRLANATIPFGFRFRTLPSFSETPENTLLILRSDRMHAVAPSNSGDKHLSLFFGLREAAACGK